MGQIEEATSVKRPKAHRLGNQGVFLFLISIKE
jgi:hypothetical protein